MVINLSSPFADGAAHEPIQKWHFQRDIILWWLRWYCKYGISYRELQEMLAERVDVDPHDFWVQRYAPEMEKRLRWYWRNPSDLCPWHSETYVKVNGSWAYLYRAVDGGAALSIFISPPVVTAKLHTGFWVKSSTT